MNVKVKYVDNVFRPLTETSDFKNGAEYLFETVKETRTVQQNRYLHKAISIIAEHIGYELEDMKILLLMHLKHTKTTLNKLTGEEVVTPASTHNLSKSDFSNLTERIIRFGAEYGINIQTPEEFYGQ